MYPNEATGRSNQDLIGNLADASLELHLALITFRTAVPEPFTTHVGKMLLRRDSDLVAAVKALGLS